MIEQLLLTFQQTDSDMGVTRNTLPQFATQLGLTETATVHLAIRHLADRQMATTYGDDGPLIANRLAMLSHNLSAKHDAFNQFIDDSVGDGVT